MTVAGISQGGGLALAVGGLADGLAAVMPDVPFLCHYPRALAITDAFPYGELVQYLAVHRDQEATVLRTMSYLDGVHFARRASAPALFSVALRDQTCPPSTVFAAYNHYAGLSAARPGDRDRGLRVQPARGRAGPPARPAAALAAVAAGRASELAGCGCGV